MHETISASPANSGLPLLIPTVMRTADAANKTDEINAQILGSLSCFLGAAAATWV